MWVGNPNKNHVKILLATLPDILWEGAEWTRLGVQDLDSSVKVKKAYRTYITKLHPDKLINSGNENHIFISNRVFAAMTEAFN